MEHNPFHAISDRGEAIELAHKTSSETGIKHVAREDFGKYLVVPLYLPERYSGEYPNHDPGFTALGVLIKESL